MCQQLQMLQGLNLSSLKLIFFPFAVHVCLFNLIKMYNIQSHLHVLIKNKMSLILSSHIKKIMYKLSFSEDYFQTTLYCTVRLIKNLLRSKLHQQSRFLAPNRCFGLALLTFLTLTSGHPIHTEVDPLLSTPAPPPTPGAVGTISTLLLHLLFVGFVPLCHA